MGGLYMTLWVLKISAVIKLHVCIIIVNALFYRLLELL